MEEPVLSDGYSGGFPSDREMEAHFARAADAANERIASCHEVVACPKCAAPVGERCCAMPLGWGGVCAQVGVGRTLKHPHRERWTLVQPAR